jgi:hypothetical protein
VPLPCTVEDLALIASRLAPAHTVPARIEEAPTAPVERE